MSNEKGFIVKYTFYYMSLMGPLNRLVRFLCFGHDKDSQKLARLVCFSIYIVNQLYKQGQITEPVSWF